MKPLESRTDFAFGLEFTPGAVLGIERGEHVISLWVISNGRVMVVSRKPAGLVLMTNVAVAPLGVFVDTTPIGEEPDDDKALALIEEARERVFAKLDLDELRMTRVDVRSPDADAIRARLCGVPGMPSVVDLREIGGGQ